MKYDYLIVGSGLYGSVYALTDVLTRILQFADNAILERL